MHCHTTVILTTAASVQKLYMHSTDAEVAGRTTAQARSLEMLGNAAFMESRSLGFHIMCTASHNVVSL